jgi:hypothetical protein
MTPSSPDPLREAAQAVLTAVDETGDNGETLAEFVGIEDQRDALAAALSATPSPAQRGFIRIRTPDDPDGWTATGDIVSGIDYQYISGDVAVILDWSAQPAPALGLDVEALAESLFDETSDTYHAMTRVDALDIARRMVRGTRGKPLAARGAPDDPE